MEPTGQSGVGVEPALAQAIEKLWVRFLPEIRERVAVLEEAASAAAATKLSAEGREAAKAAAHKLAGVLGTFSLTRGTDLARELEVAYSREETPGSDEGERLAGLAAELRELIEHRAPSA